MAKRCRERKRNDRRLYIYIVGGDTLDPLTLTQVRRRCWLLRAGAGVRLSWSCIVNMETSQQTLIGIYIFGLIFNTFQPHIHRSGRSHHHRPPSWRCSNCWTQGQTQPLLGCDFLAVNLAWIKELNEDPQQHTQSFGRAMRKEFNYRPSIVITGFNH